MIDNDRVKSLSNEQLEQLADISDEFDCFGLYCCRCPFELETPCKIEDGHVYRCSLAYAKQLYRRRHE